MEASTVEISQRGKLVRVPAADIQRRCVIVRGGWVKTASVHDEEWMEGCVVENPAEFVSGIKAAKMKADVFTFTQKATDPHPRFQYHVQWDNVALIRLSTYGDWWEKKLSRKRRQEVTRAARNGVVSERIELSDTFVKQVVKLFSEIEVKQGLPFKYRGQDFETVKKAISTFAERCDFIGAFHGGELIGYMKVVYLGKIASIMNLVVKDSHYDKRPANALMAKTVEVCEKRSMAFLQFGKYLYGNKTDSSLTEFKRRNGFEQVLIPRYYVPMTIKGQVFVRLRLYRGLLGILPRAVIAFLIRLRSFYYRHRAAKTRTGGQTEKAAGDVKSAPPGADT